MPDRGPRVARDRPDATRPDVDREGPAGVEAHWDGMSAVSGCTLLLGLHLALAKIFELALTADGSPPWRYDNTRGGLRPSTLLLRVA